MAKAKKYGTFGGVFTPSILTILGVIMYLRFPQIIGQVGLFTTIGIVLVAHIISITTGLSVASIATDKKVKSGGTYYMISRSLGLPIGGTLGLALFVGLSFSVSLYLIGFAESFLNYFDFETSKNTIRLVGTIILVLVTTITFISTSLAIKSQYFIMGAIILSLLSILLGVGGHEFAATKPALFSVGDAAPFMILFGIFFPAVTGFEAGVSMSGDLKDAKKSLPIGAMAAVGVGFLVYILLAVFFSYTVDGKALAEDPNILFKISLVPQLVIAGIWGATLSSALGSILGAPRILQATAVDKIMPKFFAKGTGKGNEPRNALLLTFVIAEAGILIGELDVIARVVSMFFITTYAFLNLAAFIESIASSDFRPDFKISKYISLLGAISSIIVMILLDFVALIGAILVLGLLLYYIRRKQLVLKSGDAWSSFSSILVKNNISKLSSQEIQMRNWLPNILYFSNSNEQDSKSEIISEAFIGKLGMLTNISVKEKQNAIFSLKNTSPASEKEIKKGIFYKELHCDNIYAGISSVTGVYGFSGVEPNTVLFDYNLSKNDEKIKQILKNNLQNKLNTIILKLDTGKPFDYKSIDFWWKGNGRHLQFAMSILRMMIQKSEFTDVKIRILIINKQSSSTKLFNNTSQVLEDYRINAEIKIIDNSIEKIGKSDIINTESANSDIIIFGISDHVTEEDNNYLHELKKYNSNTILLLPSSKFENIDTFNHSSDEIIENISSKDNQSLVFDFPETKVVQFNSILKKLYGELIADLELFEKNYLFNLISDYNNFLEINFNNSKKAISNFNKLIEIEDDYSKNKFANKSYEKYLYGIKTNTKDFETNYLIAQKETLISEFNRIKTSLNNYIIGVQKIIKVKFEKTNIKIPANKILNNQFNIKLISFYIDYLENINNSLSDILLEIQQFNITTDKSLGAILYSQKNVLETITIANEQNISNYSNIKQKITELKNHNFISKIQNLISEIVTDINAQNSFSQLSKKYKTNKKHIEKIDDGENIIEENFEKILLLNNSNYLEFNILSTKNTLWKHNNTTVDKLRHKFRTALKEKINLITEELKSNNYSVVKNPFSNSKLNLISIYTNEYSEFKNSIESLEEQITVGILNDKYKIIAQEIPFKKVIDFKIEMNYYENVLKNLINTDSELEKCFYKIQDTIRLFNFNYENIENNEENLTLQDITNSTLAKIEDISNKTISTFANFEADTNATVLNTFDDLHVYSLVHSAKKLETKINKGKRNKLFSTISNITSKISNSVYNLLINLVYQKSDGIILAEKLRKENKFTNQIQRISQLVENNSPKSTIIDDLPITYKNLFSHKFMINGDLRIERKNMINKAQKAVKMFEDNINSAIMITGEYQSGKTILAQQIASKFFDQQFVIKVKNKLSNSINIDSFKNELQKAFGTNNEIENILQNTPDKHLIIIDNIELWWLRKENGNNVINYILQLIQKYGNRHMFVLVCNIHTYNFLNKYQDIDNYFNAVIECEPFDTEMIKDAILLRHRSSNLKFKIDNKTEDKISRLKLATFFNSMFSSSNGNIGFAINTWLSGIYEYKNNIISLSKISKQSLIELEQLHPDTYNLLLLFILHKNLTRNNIVQLLQIPENQTDILINSLLRNKIVLNENDNLLINKYFLQYIIEVLKNKKFI